MSTSSTVTRLPLAVEPLEPVQVRSADAAGFLVAGRRGLLRVECAFSCLVRPEPGDTALVAWHEGGGAIIAILERPDASAMTLALPVAATVSAPALSLQAAAELGLRAGERVSVGAPELAVTAAESRLAVASVEAHGRDWSLRLNRLSVWADTLHSVARSLLQKLGVSVRVVEGVDQASVGDSLQTVRNTYSLRTQQALLSARQDVRIDGERIHMG